ncbi:MAG: hypothetical protein ACI8V2_000367 [Candidatus Latescibacterota bacterium]|jgi:hypothetical protein
MSLQLLYRQRLVILNGSARTANGPDARPGQPVHVLRAPDATLHFFAINHFFFVNCIFIAIGIDKLKTIALFTDTHLAAFTKPPH